MFNFSFVRMAGACKVHLHPNELSSKLVKSIFESVKIILENMKIVIFVVNKSIKYLLFRVYSMDVLLIKAATVMAAARMERSELGQQFLIPHPVENSWGKDRALDKERIIGEFLDFTPVMNKRRDEECIVIFFLKMKINGVQGLGLNPSWEVMLGSAPFEDPTWLGIVQWIFMVAYSHPGGSLKQDISTILLLSGKRGISSGIKYKISTVPGRTRRKPIRTSKPWHKNMILEGTYWSDKSLLDSVEDGCLLVKVTRDYDEIFKVSASEWRSGSGLKSPQGNSAWICSL